MCTDILHLLDNIKEAREKNRTDNTKVSFCPCLIELFKVRKLIILTCEAWFKGLALCKYFWLPDLMRLPIRTF